MASEWRQLAGGLAVFLRSRAGPFACEALPNTVRAVPEPWRRNESRRARPSIAGSGAMASVIRYVSNHGLIRNRIRLPVAPDGEDSLYGVSGFRAISNTLLT
jgi:hypothetical protein